MNIWPLQSFLSTIFLIIEDHFPSSINSPFGFIFRVKNIFPVRNLNCVWTNIYVNIDYMDLKIKIYLF